MNEILIPKVKLENHHFITIIIITISERIIKIDVKTSTLKFENKNNISAASKYHSTKYLLVAKRETVNLQWKIWQIQAKVIKVNTLQVTGQINILCLLKKYTKNNIASVVFT